MDDDARDDDDNDDENSINTLDYERYYNENGYRDADYPVDIDDINDDIKDDDDDRGDERKWSTIVCSRRCTTRASIRVQPTRRPSSMRG